MDIIFIFLILATLLYMRFIDPLINKREVVITLEDVTMIVYKNNEEDGTTETEIYHIEDGPVYVEIEPEK